MQDRYGNTLSTASTAARDAYVEGVDLFLASQAGVDDALDRALEEDATFAMAHIAKARQAQMRMDRETLTHHLAAARSAPAQTQREAAHIDAMGLLLEGQVPAAYKKIRAHVEDHPRDAMITQTCTSVFGLIGFSGLPGREAEQLAYTTHLLPHYGDDWWFLSMHAFAQAEVGQIGPAAETIERSLAGNPRSAHGAHIKAHIHYEAGETDAGFAYMRDWYKDFDRGALLHCHLSWHIALWALEQGDTDLMWATIDDAIAPGTSSSPPINILSDSAAIYYRAELAGIEVSTDRWKAVSDYAATCFPKPGLAFADMHAAVAHAMAGNAEALERIITDARGPAGDMVSLLAESFRAVAAQDWPLATKLLSKAMSDHERIGGSRAQRDLLEYALLNALLKQGRGEEAQLLLATRRPLKSDAKAVAGL